MRKINHLETPGEARIRIVSPGEKKKMRKMWRMWQEGVESVTDKRERVAPSPSCSNRNKQGKPRANAMGKHVGFMHTSSQTHYSPRSSNAHRQVLTSCYKNWMSPIDWLSLHSKIMQSFHYRPPMLMQCPTVSSRTSRKDIRMGVRGWEVVGGVHSAFPHCPGSARSTASIFQLVCVSDFLLYPALISFSNLSDSEERTPSSSAPVLPFTLTPWSEYLASHFFLSCDYILSWTFSS